MPQEKGNREGVDVATAPCCATCCFFAGEGGGVPVKRDLLQGKRDLPQGKRDLLQGKRDLLQGKRDLPQ